MNNLEAFERIVKLQAGMQRLVYGKKTNNINDDLVLACDSLLDEVFEVKRELNWKEWKKPKPLNLENINNEVADVFIFFMNMLNALDVDIDEFFDIVLKKMVVNIQRQENGY